jgi:lysozyme family protein
MTDAPTTTIEALRPDYEAKWRALVIRPERKDEARKMCQRILMGKPQYEIIEKRTGVPWWFTGLLHYRESSNNFKTWLGNGDPLNQVSTHAPKGEGPFKTFEDGAIRALEMKALVGATDWSQARVAFRFEGYNGFGYRRHDVNSPYLYGGSTLYGPPESKAGKYIADGPAGWDANHNDQQLGVLVLLRTLMDMDTSITFTSDPVLVNTPDPDDELAHGVLWVQWALNHLGADPPLVEDGEMGEKTHDMVMRFQKENRLAVTGTPDEKTMNAIEAHLAPVLIEKQRGGEPVKPLEPPATGLPKPPDGHPSAPASAPLTVSSVIRAAFKRLFG